MLRPTRGTGIRRRRTDAQTMLRRILPSQCNCVLFQSGEARRRRTASAAPIIGQAAIAAEDCRTASVEVRGRDVLCDASHQFVTAAVTQLVQGVRYRLPSELTCARSLPVPPRCGHGSGQILRALKIRTRRNAARAAGFPLIVTSAGAAW